MKSVIVWGPGSLTGMAGHRIQTGCVLGSLEAMPDTALQPSLLHLLSPEQLTGPLSGIPGEESIQAVQRPATKRVKWAERASRIPHPCKTAESHGEEGLTAKSLGLS